MPPIQETSISPCHPLDWSKEEHREPGSSCLLLFHSEANARAEHSTVSRGQNNAYSPEFLRTA